MADVQDRLAMFVAFWCRGEEYQFTYRLHTDSSESHLVALWWIMGMDDAHILWMSVYLRK